MTHEREKTIAEILDLSKPVSDCPECGGLGEIGQLGSRRKCECLFIRVKTLKSELDREREQNRKLIKELENCIKSLKYIATNPYNHTHDDWAMVEAQAMLNEMGVTWE